MANIYIMNGINNVLHLNFRLKQFTHFVSIPFDPTSAVSLYIYIYIYIYIVIHRQTVLLCLSFLAWVLYTRCFKLGLKSGWLYINQISKNATEMYGMLQTAFQPSCMNRASVFEWNKRFKEGRESVRDDERCGRSKEVKIPELIGQRVRVRATMLRF